MEWNFDEIEGPMYVNVKYEIAEGRHPNPFAPDALDTDAGRRLGLFILFSEGEGSGFYKNLSTPNAWKYANSIVAWLTGEIPDLYNHQWDMDKFFPLIWGYKKPIRGAGPPRGGGEVGREEGRSGERRGGKAATRGNGLKCWSQCRSQPRLEEGRQ